MASARLARANDDSNRRLRFLIEVGNMFAASLEYEPTLTRIARLAVSAGLCHACLFDVVDEDGHPGLVAVASNEPQLEERLQSAGHFLRSDSGQPPHPVLRVLIEGVPYVANDIDENYLRTEASGAAHAAFMRDLSYRQKLVVPVLVGLDNVVGALTLVRVKDAPPFTPDEIEMAEDIGRRAGVAYENARSYARQLRVATLLQEGALPRVLPPLPNGRFDAMYVPGSREALIGGDWYDAFPLDGGLYGITVGDVLGKGVGAAVTMGRLRQAMQAAAYVAPDPNQMLHAADRVLALNDPDVYATALAGIFDSRACRLTFASAGHIGPFERRADGSLREYTTPGWMLGLDPEARHDAHTLQLQSDSLLVFITDGLVEQTRDLEEGYQRVRAAIAGLRPAEPRPAARIIEGVIDGALRDDVAVLVLAMHECPAPPAVA
jgi:phosphoserine phosphatase RsbU/P